MLDQSAQQEAYRRAYGGSDNTAPSFIRPAYLQYNSLSKSRDLGRVDNYGAILTGVVGGHTGRSTLFFRIETTAIAKVGILKSMDRPITDRTISVGVLDANHNPMPLGEDGFSYLAPIHNSANSGFLDRMPPGTYYFTVSTNQWRETPFSVTVLVQRYLELNGRILLRAAPRLRLALVKLSGPATGRAPLIGTLLAPISIKELTGAAIGAMTPRLTLSIMRGAAIGRMEPYGRLQQNYRISGAATGRNANIATMTARKPYGYGY